MTHASSSPNQQAIDLGRAWLEAYAADPEVPERSEQFTQVQALIDMHLQSNSISLDSLVSEAFVWISSQGEGESSIRFMHALLPHFETLTQEDDEVALAAYLVALPVIGEQEHATHVARNAGELGFDLDLINAGIIPPAAKVHWLPRTVSVQEAGSWLADHRRALLVAGLEGKLLIDAIDMPEEKFGIDRAQLSMVVGVVVSPEDDIEVAMADPGFLYASADDFSEDAAEDDPSQWAMERRTSALLQASDAMSTKLVERGLEGTVIEEPGTLTEALSTLVSWSLRLQQLEEAQVLGMSQSDLDAALSRAIAQVALDVPASQVSMAIDLDGRIMGPFWTDLPWRCLPVSMVGEGILKRSIAPNPDAIGWHATSQQMWSATSGVQRKWRMH